MTRIDDCHESIRIESEKINMMTLERQQGKTKKKDHSTPPLSLNNSLLLFLLFLLPCFPLPLPIFRPISHLPPPLPLTLTTHIHSSSTSTQSLRTHLSPPSSFILTTPPTPSTPSQPSFVSIISIMITFSSSRLFPQLPPRSISRPLELPHNATFYGNDAHNV